MEQSFGVDTEKEAVTKTNYLETVDYNNPKTIENRIQQILKTNGLPFIDGSLLHCITDEKKETLLEIITSPEEQELYKLGSGPQARTLGMLFSQQQQQQQVALFI
jgi:hypothetical protein